MNIGIFLFRALYFFLPAYLTNITASLSRKIKFLKFIEKPVDLGRTLKGYPIFGSHKTWRGVICGVVTGILTVYSQRWFYQYQFTRENSLVAYDKIDVFVFGFLMSLGAALGDLFFAFLKRRQRIAPGAPWIPFDQINYVIGAFFFLMPFFPIDFIYWLTILVFTFLLHLIFNYLGYYLGLSRAKF